MRAATIFFTLFFAMSVFSSSCTRRPASQDSSDVGQEGSSPGPTAKKSDEPPSDEMPGADPGEMGAHLGEPPPGDDTPSGESEVQEALSEEPQTIPSSVDVVAPPYAPPPRYKVCMGHNPERCGAVDDKGEVIVPFEDVKKRRLFSRDAGCLLRVDANGRGEFLDVDGSPLRLGSIVPDDCVREGYAVVKVDSKCGYADVEGQIVIPPQWDYCYGFDNGIGRVVRYLSVPNTTDDDIDETEREYYRNSLRGYVDRDGKIVVDLIFGNLSFFVDDRAVASVSRHVSPERLEEFGKKWGYIDRSGKPITKFEFDMALDFHHGRALVKKDLVYYEDQFCYKNGFISTEGKFIWPLTLGFADSFNDSGFAWVAVCDEDALKRGGWVGSCKYGVIRADGTYLFELGRFRFTQSFSEGRAFVYDHDGWSGYVDESGNRVFAASIGSDFVNGLAIVKRFWLRGTCFKEDIVDQNGKSIFPFGTPKVSFQDRHFDRNGVLVGDVLSDKAKYQHVVLHRDRGVIWPPEWNVKGAGKGVLCWRDAELSDEMREMPEDEKASNVEMNKETI